MNYGMYTVHVRLRYLPLKIFIFTFCSSKAKGRRLGYMGHLTFISDEVIKVLASYPDEIYAVVKDSLDLDAWDTYINGPLRETKLRDRVPLGGIKPAGGLDGLEHDMMTEDITRQIAEVKGDFADEDDDDEEDGMGGWIR